MNRKKSPYVCSLFYVFWGPIYVSASASANLSLQDFTEKLSLKGDLRVRYEYKEKDVSNEDPTDRMRQRFRLA
ncbi:MAG: hypothetical protein R2874_15585 [Desulfobacterales bacterium]